MRNETAAKLHAATPALLLYFCFNRATEAIEKKWGDERIKRSERKREREREESSSKEVRKNLKMKRGNEIDRLSSTAS